MRDAIDILVSVILTATLRTLATVLHWWICGISLPRCLCFWTRTHQICFTLAAVNVSYMLSNKQRNKLQVVKYLELFELSSPRAAVKATINYQYWHLSPDCIVRKRLHKHISLQLLRCTTLDKDISFIIHFDYIMWSSELKICRTSPLVLT